MKKILCTLLTSLIMSNMTFADQTVSYTKGAIEALNNMYQKCPSCAQINDVVSRIQAKKCGVYITDKVIYDNQRNNPVVAMLIALEMLEPQKIYDFFLIAEQNINCRDNNIWGLMTKRAVDDFLKKF